MAANAPFQVASVWHCPFQWHWTLLPVDKSHQKEFVLYGSAVSRKKYCSGDSLPSESKTHDVLGDKG